MKYANLLFLAFLICFFITGSISVAEVPLYFSYQGRLTDDAGTPVTNTSPGVEMVFTIWFSELETDPGYIMWSSGPVTVPVENGLFEYNIGPLASVNLLYLKDSPDYWLGIQIGEDPELSPRTKLTSVPYACHSASSDNAETADNATMADHATTADNATSADNATTADNAASADYAATIDDIYVDETGDIMTGDLLFDLDEDTQNDAAIYLSGRSADFCLYDDGMPTAILYGSNWGELAVFSPAHMWGSRVHLAGRSDQSYLMLSAENSNVKSQLSAYNAGGKLEIRDGSDVLGIVMDGGQTGDDAVLLPENAISNTEILDEPGIVYAVDYGTKTLSNSISDIVKLDISIPADGYIMVMARGGTHLWGTTSYNWAAFQIDETSGGSFDAGYLVEIGAGVFPNVNTFAYSVYVDRVYYKTAGHYEFRLEGSFMSIDPSAGANVTYSSITAVYYPTSYASIKSLVSDPGDYPDPKMVTSINPITNNEETVYEIDLRYYELKAKEAKVRALQAELELRQKQDEMERQPVTRENRQ